MKKNLRLEQSQKKLHKRMLVFIINTYRNNNKPTLTKSPKNYEYD